MGTVHRLRKPNLLIPRSRIELVSVGIDEALQGLAGDPFGGTSWVGLRVPSFVTHGPQNRYLFQLCTFTLPEGINGWVRGFRQGWSLGTRQIGTDPDTVRVVEQFVEDPWFKLPDANISWHMRLMAQHEPFGFDPNPGQIQDPAAGGNQQNLAFLNANGPALLFQNVATPDPFYVNLTAYTPPNAGKPWGEPLTGELATFYDLKTPWRSAQAWHALDIRIQGPCRVVFYASVQQSNPLTRTDLQINLEPFPCGIPCEEQFLLNFPDAIIWRVAGAMIVEFDEHCE